MVSNRNFAWLAALTWAGGAVLCAQTAVLDHFEARIRPVLASKCYACHSTASPVPQAGLSLDTPVAIRRGGRSGPVVVPGDPDRSLLIRAIRRTDKQLQMPPGPALPADVVADFETWVRNGAQLPADSAAPAVKKPALWSLKKPELPPAPTVAAKERVRNDIDAFVIQKLESKGLFPSPEADKHTLIRRIAFDLTGLPPSAEEIQKFVADTSPNAYENLVERLLASPAYGERWGRHWLDVARYADSVNDSVNTGQRYAWSYTYRDWVIRAFNEDLPYDKFLLYQLAADRVPNGHKKNLAALGFLSLGREFPKSFPETVDDRIDAVARGMLGMTVACARCHDHKFDPIPTADYYSMYSILSNIREPKDLPPVAVEPETPKQALYRERLEKIRQADHEYRVRRNAEMVAFFKSQTADYLVAAHDAEGLGNIAIEELVRDRQLNQYILERWRKHLDAAKASADPVFRLWTSAAAIPSTEFAAKWASTQAATKVPAVLTEELKARPVSALKDVAAAYAAAFATVDKVESITDPDAQQFRTVMRGSKSPVDIPVDEFPLIYTEGDSNNTRSIKVRYNTMLAQSAYDGAVPRAMAVEDVPSPEPTHIFLRGNSGNPGALAPAHFLSCLGGGADLYKDGSGRLELARDITSPDNPLTARVLVNRVWMHHFGAGLVRTPSDFGNRGEAPTHPELLDYLAVKFMQSGWSVKALHRMILLSATYRQSSADAEAGRKADPENTLLWRMNRQRIDVESLRDAMLVASGRLEKTVGGVPFSLVAEPAVPRRTVYGLVERGKLPGVLGAFDFASPDQHAPMRFTTTVPQQALFFLNSPFVAEQSRAMAARVLSDGGDDQTRIVRLYRWVFGRDPEKRELEAGLKFVSGADPDAPPSAPSDWKYGIGDYRADSGRVVSFTEFPAFVADRWQGGSVLPAGKFGKAFWRAGAGEPGEGPGQTLVLRWTSPVDGAIAIDGTFRHGQGAVPFGDGVRGRVVSSRLGEIASWSINGSSADTRLNGIKVEKGDTLDFIVDEHGDPENDGFSWSPAIKLGDRTWNAKNDFAGPSPRHLGAWSRYAAVLFESNEFAFVD